VECDELEPKEISVEEAVEAMDVAGGPAQVANSAYRTGWEQTFGKRKSREVN
jgi:hypothetical protein